MIALATIHACFVDFLIRYLIYGKALVRGCPTDGTPFEFIANSQYGPGGTWTGFDGTRSWKVVDAAPSWPSTARATRRWSKLMLCVAAPSLTKAKVAPGSASFKVTPISPPTAKVGGADAIDGRAAKLPSGSNRYGGLKIS